jgi:hypothetical protein
MTHDQLVGQLSDLMYQGICANAQTWGDLHPDDRKVVLVSDAAQAAAKAVIDAGWCPPND